MNAPLKVGDVCVTVNTRLPAINDGVLVVIVGVNHTIRSYRGEAAPYSIRRVDGQALGSTNDKVTGKLSWSKCTTAWCAGYKLKRVDDKGQDQRDKVRESQEVPA